jgi:flagellar hook-associated protein FlgK
MGVSTSIKEPEKETSIQSLIDESQRLMQTIYETSNQNSSFQELPESDRLEIYSLTERLNQLLRQIQKEGEAL